MHATNSWLMPSKVNIALGPDCDDSPHSIREAPLDLGIAPYLAVLFGPQKNDKDHQDKKVKQGVTCFRCFFSCIAERARGIVGQLLEIRKRSETLIECRISLANRTKVRHANPIASSST